ncbi:MAG: bifunctional DNA-formamidopyrimidine glycosylase/DNA-(apurinic or apyrimidinic site) lyase [Pelovirga sp.]
MPELPEVETVCRGLAPHIRGKTVLELILRAAKLRQPLDRELCRILPGQVIVKVERRAKYLILHCERGGLLIHLGMSGVLRLVPAGTTEQKHDHIDLIFTDGSCLRMTDPRRFGQFIYCPEDPLQHPLLHHLGPEPLADDFDGAYLYRRSRGRQQAVKTFLMDQRIVVGVGNIYASEALFRAGIHPARPAGRVGRERYERLVQMVRDVLVAAIAAGGTTISDFRSSAGRPGYFRQELLVYGRAGAPCCRCGTALRSQRLGQRSTFYCSHCQR